MLQRNKKKHGWVSCLTDIAIDLSRLDKSCIQHLNDWISHWHCFIKAGQVAWW